MTDLFRPFATALNTPYSAMLGAGTAAVGDPFWMETILHQGISAFNSNPNTYKVFRNVKNYGAVGDGVNDDTAAIKSASFLFALRLSDTSHQRSYIRRQSVWRQDMFFVYVCDSNLLVRARRSPKLCIVSRQQLYTFLLGGPKFGFVQCFDSLIKSNTERTLFQRLSSPITSHNWLETLAHRPLFAPRLDSLVSQSSVRFECTILPILMNLKTLLL